MVERKINIDLREALRDLRALGDKLQQSQRALRGLKKEGTTTQQSVTLDTGKMTASFALLGAVAGGAMAAMISNSPLLATQVAQLTFQFNLLFMTLGNALAPVLQPLVDWLISALKWFQSLPAPVQEFISLSIALTAAVSALALAVMALSTVSLPLIAIVVGVGAAIAAVITVWRNWGRIMDWAREHMALFVGIVGLLTVALGPIVLLILGVMAVIKNWGAIVEWFGGVWTAFLGGLGQAGAFMQELIDSGVQVFRGVINSISAWINEWIIAPINAVLVALRNIKIGGAQPFSWVGQLPEIPQFAAGTMNVPQDMLAMVHKGEIIIPRSFAEDIRRGNASGMGGGMQVTINIQSPVVRQDSDLEAIARQVEEAVTQQLLHKLQRQTSWR